MSPELWDLAQKLGVPVTMLLAFIWSIHKKIFVPGWYPGFLEELLGKSELKIKALEEKNEGLIQKGFAFSNLARTALDVGKAVVEKEN